VVGAPSDSRWAARRGGPVWVRLLGPIDVVADGGPRPVPGLRAKAVLAALALRPGEIVEAGRLADIVWDGRPTATALQSQISRLRSVLGQRSAIRARSSGYTLELAGESTDAQTVERLTAEAGECGDLRVRRQRLQEAVGFSHGRPLGELSELAWFQPHGQRLEQLLLRARLALVDTRLALGEHLELLPELEEFVHVHPLDEQIHQRLMLALYRSGRQADALAAYKRVRQTLDDALGIEPSQPLRDLQTAILRQDPELAIAGVRPRVDVAQHDVAAARPVPAQLPPGIDSFTGRSSELAQLDGLLAGMDGGTSATTVVISAISGAAGIGKTTLAVHWARRAAATFPDGQLHVNLRGYDPSGSPVEPAAALRGFLDAFEVPASQIPENLDAQVNLYRSLLAGKRVLVVLDNARDAEQVRPLLPSAPGSFAVVTSRSPLSPLIAAEAAHSLILELPSIVEARDLMARRLGSVRTAAEPEALEEIIVRCARLPLALVVAAARAASRPDFPLAAVASQLRQATLDVLAGGDAKTDIRTVFAWSYQALSADAARLFRLLGLHPGPDTSTAAAASLAGVQQPRARSLLDELTAAQLVTEHAPGRFTFHDLMRAYAAERTRTRDSSEVRHDAMHRMFDHYLHTACTAVLRLRPGREPIDLDPPALGVVAERVDSHSDAEAWFNAELPTLLATIERAAAADFGTHAWQLAWAVRPFVLRRGGWHQLVAAQHAALDATRRLDEPLGQAFMLHGLGLTYLRWGQIDAGAIHFRQALDLYTVLGHLGGQAHTRVGLAETAERQGRLHDALVHNERALDLHRRAGNQHGEAGALNSIGWSHAQLGDYEQALEYCVEAVARLHELGDLTGEAGAWDSVGYAHRGRSNYEEAARCYWRAVELNREAGDRYSEADALDSLSDNYDAAGDRAAARQVLTQALTIFDEINHPRAEEVRVKLRKAIEVEATPHGDPVEGQTLGDQVETIVLEKGAVTVSDRGRAVRSKGEGRPLGPPDQGVRDGAIPDLVRPRVDGLP
jgi:DNA-binding SARP family transcriptional activator/tetratricopeptide (TPR) repeat protein